MGNFANRTPRQKPVVMNCAITTKTFKKRDGSEGTCGVFRFEDGSTTFSVQVVLDKNTGKTTKNGKPITGWAQVAKFSGSGSGNGGW